MKLLNDESQYLQVLRRIHEEGTWKDTLQKDAAGQPLRTRGVPCAQMEFNLSGTNTFPLTTLRPLGGAFHMFIGEVLWILSGCDSLEMLNKYGVHYWDEWADEEKCGWKNLPVGHFGRTYGPQWRDFRGPEGSTDQLKRLFKLLREKPTDKRMRVTAWHPNESDNLVVRPCHGDFYLYNNGEGKIDMNLLQMSADMPIGIPSNIVMYAFLLKVLAMIHGFEPGVLTHTTYDTHYYSNQVEGVAALLEREPLPYPEAVISPALAELVRVMVDDDIRDPLSLPQYNPEGLPYLDWLKREMPLTGYTPHKSIPRELLPVAI
ncbi:thymidylate synthase [soil metagenome]